MKKVLIVTHVSGFVPQFEMNNVRILQGMGYEVHYASNFRHVHYGKDNHRLDGTGIIRHQVDFSRSPFKICSNRKAYKQLRNVIEEDSFEIIHCHTPVASVYTRILARNQRKKGTRVIYTSHGFHFYKGGPLKYRLFYPIERFMARYTDVLITINEEDFLVAKNFRLAKRDGKEGKVFRIEGVGLDTGRYVQKREIREKKRAELGVAEGEFLLLSIGELNRNKNHVVAVAAMGCLKHLPIRYLICGTGPERGVLLEKAMRLQVEDKVSLLGFREDIPELLAAADGLVFPSHREGLGLVAIEALAAGVPVIASDNRGTREYMEDGKNGYVVFDNTPEGIVNAVEKLYNLSKEDYEKMRMFCKKSAERFSAESVSRKMEAIYRE